MVWIKLDQCSDVSVMNEGSRCKMARKKTAHLSETTLFEMGDAMAVQNSILKSMENERDEINEGIDVLESNNSDIKNLHENAENLADILLAGLERGDVSNIEFEKIFTDENDDPPTKTPYIINKTKAITTYNSWSLYVDVYNEYAKEKNISLKLDPYLISLSAHEYSKLNDEINGEFARKTSIINKTDLAFLAIATALQTTKALLFPFVAEKAGYGTSFDKNKRLSHDDKSIKNIEQGQKDAYKQKQMKKGNSEGEWTEILYRKPIFDTTKGSPDIGVNMEGGYHRIHTLGHDPVLGWIFGTSNILTDTITLNTFQTYKGQRNPIKILPIKVPFVQLFGDTIEAAKRNKLNLPAAIAAEGIHLKSDEFTKVGLPVPILETFAPEFAGNLYKNQYDALCFARDVKVIGASAAISMFIDMIINLTHAMYYNAEKDGSRDLYEIRTRKILLVSNTIATTSNIIYSVVSQNPKALDIGGLLVTVSHLFRDTSFILNVKREFIENRIYEKIDEEMRAIEENKDRIFTFEYQNLSGVRFL